MASLRDRSQWPDGQLLQAVAACDDQAFSAFYRRHLGMVVGWCLRRTGDPELAADLTAEVFAVVLEGAARYERRGETAVGWLLGIARNVLGHSIRSGQVDARARRRLGVPALCAEDEDLARVLDLADDRTGEVADLLAGLPPDEATAVSARVIQEREYGEIAQGLGCSEMVIRKRVSRGLARLRAGMAAP